MSDFSFSVDINNESNSALENYLNVLECTFDINTNKISEAETCLDYKNVSDSFKCFDMSYVSGAYCTDYSPINKCKGIDLAVTIQAEDVNIDSVCPNFFVTSNYKGIDLKSSTCSLLEDSTQLTNSLNSESYNVDSSLDIPVPKKSFITMQNCFDVSKACGYSLKTYELINRIEIALSEKVEMSYEFDQKYFMWNAVYIKGSTHCKFQVHVYSDNESLLMEIHKLSGDSIIFHSIARDIKNSVFGVKEEYAESMCPVSSTIQPCDVLSDADAFAAMELFQEIMVTEPFDESQFEVCHNILDDLFPQ